MNLVEFEAKALLRQAGLPVPAARVLQPQDPVPTDKACVIKAQVPFGGRGKQGLVVLAAPEEVEDKVALLRQRMQDRGFAPVLLLEEPMQGRETYLAWRIDDVGQRYVLSFSPVGGVEIESQAGQMHELPFDPRQVPGAHDFIDFFERLGFKGRTLAALARFAAGSWRVFIQNDAHLVEINPLTITPRGDVVALDAKVVLDDNADARHLDWTQLHSATLTTAGQTELEQRAQRAGLFFLELEGETAVLSGGAGLGMALLDMLGDAGMPAANFVDTSGGSAASVYVERTSIVFERARRDDVKAILFYLTISASNIARHVRTLLDILDKSPAPKPMVIGLLCAGAAEREMTFAQAQAQFAQRGYACARDLKGVMTALHELRQRHG